MLNDFADKPDRTGVLGLTVFIDVQTETKPAGGLDILR